jgi:hypothetical protein
MKAFQFRLDQALRWRHTQAELEKARVSLAAQRVRQIQGEIRQREEELTRGAAQLATGNLTGSSLAAWAALTDRSHRQIKEMKGRAAEAEEALTAHLQTMVEANRRLQLLENLRQSARSQWECDLSRELEAFAGESYLFRLQSKNGRARSSGG